MHIKLKQNGHIMGIIGICYVYENGRIGIIAYDTLVAFSRGR